MVRESFDEITRDELAAEDFVVDRKLSTGRLVIGAEVVLFMVRVRFVDLDDPEVPPMTA